MFAANFAILEGKMEIITTQLMASFGATQIGHFQYLVHKWTMIPHQNHRKSPPIDKIGLTEEYCDG